MKVYIISFLSILGVCVTQAQDSYFSSDTLKVVYDSISESGYSMEMDKEILSLSKAKIKTDCTVKVKVTDIVTADINDLRPEVLCRTQTKIPGYRIQIYYSKDRNAANKVLASFRQQYPGIVPELRYYNPDFRVLVGDYFTKRSASSDFKKIKKQYPGSLMLKDRIYCRRAK